MQLFHIYFQYQFTVKCQKTLPRMYVYVTHLYVYMDVHMYVYKYTSLTQVLQLGVEQSIIEAIRVVLCLLEQNTATSFFLFTSVPLIFLRFTCSYCTHQVKEHLEHKETVNFHFIFLLLKGRNYTNFTMYYHYQDKK